MTIREHIPLYIKRTARAVGMTIWLNDCNAWAGLTVVLTARLSTQKRAALAWSALRSLRIDQAADVANAVIPERTSPPVPPLFNYMDEAAFWADMAEPEALDAYCLASFNRMAAARQADFLEFVQGRRAA